jgi:hypothetical protein
MLNVAERNNGHPVDSFCFRLLIAANVSNGKDSRIRGIKVFKALTKRDVGLYDALR